MLQSHAARRSSFQSSYHKVQRTTEPLSFPTSSEKASALPPSASLHLPRRTLLRVPPRGERGKEKRREIHPWSLTLHARAQASPREGDCVGRIHLVPSGSRPGIFRWTGVRLLSDSLRSRHSQRASRRRGDVTRGRHIRERPLARPPSRHTTIIRV